MTYPALQKQLKIQEHTPSDRKAYYTTVPGVGTVWGRCGDSVGTVWGMPSVLPGGGCNSLAAARRREVGTALTHWYEKHCPARSEGGAISAACSPVSSASQIFPGVVLDAPAASVNLAAPPDPFTPLSFPILPAEACGVMAATVLPATEEALPPSPSPFPRPEKAIFLENG